MLIFLFFSSSSMFLLLFFTYIITESHQEPSKRNERIWVLPKILLNLYGNKKKNHNKRFSFQNFDFLLRFFFLLFWRLKCNYLQINLFHSQNWLEAHMLETGLVDCRWWGVKEKCVSVCEYSYVEICSVFFYDKKRKLIFSFFPSFFLVQKNGWKRYVNIF